ncbi:Protein kinase domain [Macleaya cordata]|uniref:Protein kinase domain n=1 Tax=Macleaya cordata TaxID=56857 RepID=A0A200PS77_MACCD|nr:Protein kinase domain [Macleaya cordata]
MSRLSENLFTAVLLAVLIFPVISTAKKPFNYNADSFNETHYQLFTKLGGASINNNAIQITPDSINNDFSLLNKSGRLMFNKPFKFWDSKTLPAETSDNNKNNSSSFQDIVASFNSTFLINVFPVSPSKIPAEGLAFIIAPDLEIPLNSEGGWLGLTNATLDGNLTNKFVAIELDTSKQDYDPDSNHMGLNINSVKSIKTVSLSDYDIVIADVGGKNYTVWIQYNGRTKFMEVFMAEEGKPKPAKPFLNESINLKDHVNQNSYFGFSGSTGNTAQLNCVLKWNLTMEILPGDKNHKPLKIGLGVGIPSVVLLVIVFGVLGYYWNKSGVVDDPRISWALKSLPGTPREFTFKELKNATSNFDEKMKLGQGGFGVVYKGELANEDTVVAVKKFSRESMKGKDDFLAELTIINRLRHKHLVRLVGWCHKNGMLLLVYDYMPNGSLDKWLFGGPDKILSWDNRFKITYGVASALHYLHNEYDQKVVHRDLKASNIMLDSDFNARLGDFGLARAIENERTSYAELEGVQGTVGYIAPECLLTGKATRESDVFGFGAVVLELVCGQRPWTKIAGFQFLVDWVWKLYREGRILEAVDRRLGNDYVHEQAEKLLLLGLACSHPIANERPKTQTIFQIVSGSASVPFIHPFKPAFVWPTMDPFVEEEERTATKSADEIPVTSSSSYDGSSSLSKSFITTIFFAVLVFPAISTAQNPEYFNYYENNFNETHYELFQTLSSASIDGGALQITPDSLNDKFSLLNKSGRAMFKQRFKFWEPSKNKNSSDDTVASFNSTFLVNVYPASQNKIPAEGLAFIIAPDLEIPLNSEGQWLGLTNQTIDGNLTNKFVAIELDTSKQDFDPDNNHLGLNINSVISNKTVSLSQYNITIAPDPANATNYTLWVQYDGKSKLLEVFMAEEGESKPKNPFLREILNLREYLNQYSYFGFSASTGSTAQLNCVLMWNLTMEMLPEEKDRGWLKILLGVGIPGVVFLVILLGGLGYYWKKSRHVDDPNILGALKSLPGTPREFTFKELKKATNNFDEKMKLGQGGFGVVFKGVLANENTVVAVKKFSRENIKGKDDFLSELTIINRLRHRHLVRLVGWCHKNGMLLLVYDYMPNGSLDNHLFGGPENILSWDHRYKIIYGVASALHYLHNEYDQKVVHRDLKASNIMLDADFNARLGDFGLARAIENERTSYAELEGVPGTIGYIAPECFHTGKATRESDIYGFGAVVLEVVCGERPWTKIAGFTFLVDWVWKLYREGRILEAVDERLGNDYVAEQAEKLLLLGLACSHPIAGERPKTQTIFQIVSGSAPVPFVPPFKPAFVWPSMEPTEESSMTNTPDETPMNSSFYGSSGWSVQCESRESYKRYSDESSSVV